METSARTTEFIYTDSSAGTVSNKIGVVDWSKIKTQEELDMESEQRKADNKLHIYVRRKEMFRK